MLSRRTYTVVAVVLLLTAASSPAAARLKRPQALVATAASSAQIDLAWIDPNTTSIGYAVERRIPPVRTFTHLATVPAGTTTYSDLGLASATRHRYRVRALAPDGTRSAPSRTALGTTWPEPTTPTSSTSTSSTSSTSTSTSSTTTSTRATTSTSTSSTSSTSTSTSSTTTSTRATTSTSTSTSTSTTRSTTTSTSTSTSTSSTSTSARPTTSTTTSSTTTTLANQRPIASAGPDQLSQTLTPLAFSAAGSTDPDGSITTYAWRFGDGAVASGAGASHAYARPGSYMVTLTVTDNGGLTGSDTAMVVASDRPPTANAGPDRNGTAGTAITLSGSGTDPDGTIASYAWVLGDGQSASGASVSHTYASAGVYVATLTVTDDSGAQASDSAVMIVTATPVTLPWLRRLGGTGSDIGQAVTVAPNGDVIVVGYFAGMVDFGGGPLVASGAFDLFVARYTAGGTHVWSRRFGGTDQVIGQAVAVAPNGDIAVTGYFTATADFGGGALTSAGQYDTFLAVYSGTGAYKWARRFGSTSDEIGYGVAVDAAGNVFMTGFFRMTVDFGGGAFTSVASGLDCVVAKYAGADGTHLWSRKFTNSSADIGYAVAVDGSGNAVVTGSFMGRLNFGCGEMTSAGMHDAFVAKLAGGTGTCLWSRRYGGTATDRGQSVAVGPGGEVAVTGFYTFDVDFGAGLVAGVGANDVFVAVLGGADGATRWARGVGGRYGDYGYGVAVLAGSDVVVTGSFQDSADFGTGPLASAGLEDVFVARYAAATGAAVWVRRYGGTSTDYGYGVAGAGDHAVATGYFQGTADFGTGPTTSAGLHDVFLVGLAP